MTRRVDFWPPCIPPGRPTREWRERPSRVCELEPLVPTWCFRTRPANQEDVARLGVSSPSRSKSAERRHVPVGATPAEPDVLLRAGLHLDRGPPIAPPFGVVSLPQRNFGESGEFDAPDSQLASETVYRRQRSRIYEIGQIDTDVNLEFPQSHTEAYGIVHLVVSGP